MRKSRLETKNVATLDKTKGKGGLNSNESLAEVQKALRAAQAEVRRERQARIQAEKALIEAQEKLVDAQLEVEQNPQSQTRRVSFVVRLTLDEQGQFGRTEIEQVSSGKKQNFLSLDGDLLVAFMRSCINPETIPEDAISTKPR
jgi:multidrug resistance efflux pump